ncbi:hypothetical protein ACFX12_046536 [Malus domestica]
MKTTTTRQKQVGLLEPFESSYIGTFKSFFKIRRRDNRKDKTISQNTKPTMMTNSKRCKVSYCLPEEISINILTRLPVKSLVWFRCVSKPWLGSSNFIGTHLNKDVTDLAPTYLIALHDCRDWNLNLKSRICICNPSIKKYVRLELELEDDDGFYVVYRLEESGHDLAFGFNPRLNDYKSIGANPGWIKDMDRYFGYEMFNGVAHWIMGHGRVTEPYYRVSFGTGIEVFRKLKLPIAMSSRGNLRRIDVGSLVVSTILSWKAKRCVSEEISMDNLARLPAKSLLIRFVRVSKPWNNLIGRLGFIG